MPMKDLYRVVGGLQPTMNDFGASLTLKVCSGMQAATGITVLGMTAWHQMAAAGC